MEIYIWPWNRVLGVNETTSGALTVGAPRRLYVASIFNTGSAIISRRARILHMRFNPRLPIVGIFWTRAPHSTYRSGGSSEVRPYTGGRSIGVSEQKLIVVYFIFVHFRRNWFFNLFLAASDVLSSFLFSHRYWQRRFTTKPCKSNNNYVDRRKTIEISKYVLTNYIFEIFV